jgi:hypothetical protein
MTHLYISGPISGKPDLNFPAFHEAARLLRAAGYTVTNPAELDAQDAGKTLTWEQYMRRDIKALMDCDGVALLPGWTESRGANLETEIAGRLGMKLWGVDGWLRKAQEQTRAARSAATR